MLKDHKFGQPIVYKTFLGILKTKKFHHAYLFYANNYIYTKQLVIDFAKALICKKEEIVEINCGECLICKRIDNNNFPEIKIINTEDLWIKKEEISELKEKFNLKSLEGTKRVYIIYDAEKMNKHAANSMLKFLEEPVDNVIAILVTNNPNQILKTIDSRCQKVAFCNKSLKDYIKLFQHQNPSLVKLASLIYRDETEINKFIKNQETLERISLVVNVIKRYEQEKLKSLVSNQVVWFDTFDSSQKFTLALDIMICFYKDILNYSLVKKIEVFDNYKDAIIEIATLNSKNNIIRKIQIIINNRDFIKNNVNLNLLFDKIFIDLEGGI